MTAPFATLDDTEAPLRVILVGGGSMGTHWLRTLANIADARVVGLVDLNPDSARAALAAADLGDLPVGASVTELAAATGAQAVINATVPVAHHPVNVEAMRVGLPVLCEKPITPTVAQAISLAATSEVTGQLLMTSQNRRYYDSMETFRAHVRSLGPLGLATAEFFRDPRMTGFRAEMDNPLLVDMSIHTFDAARYVLQAEPVSVYCDAFNPSWSGFAGSAAAAALFEMTGGVRFVYSGSWCAPGLDTSWNSSWRVSGQRGTALWDGERATSASLDPEAGTEGSALAAEWSRPAGSGEEIAGSFAEFVRALRTGATPSGEVHSNIRSLAMVEAAVRSASNGQREYIAEVLEEAYRDAIAAESFPEVREQLVAWGSASAGLA